MADPKLKELLQREFSCYPERPENSAPPDTSGDWDANGEIEINRRTRGFKLQFHGLAALQNPRSFGFEKKASQQAVKGDLPPESLQIQSLFPRVRLEPFFQRGAEGLRR